MNPTSVTRRAYVLLVLVLLSAACVLAQSGTIIGRVVSKSDREPLVGANVLLGGTLRGTVTDADGEFTFTGVPAGIYSITISLIGYERVTRMNIRVSPAETTNVTVDLIPSPIQTAPVVVTASKREQSLQESPVSVSVMDATSIAYRNSVTIDDALRYIPGVNITQDQVNVRGSSGYSRGAGSRVLILVDGIPFITGDTGEINFETIPVGQVERIEVVKGASSALYGSSALGGVINVITKPISQTPETHIRTYGGFYSTPSYRQWEWTSDTRYFDGLSLSHSRRIGDVGLLVHGSRKADDGYRQNDFRRRYNGYLKVKYDPTAYSALTGAFNILHQKRASFLYWKNLTEALVPPADQLGDGVQSTRFSMSSQYGHILSEKLMLTTRAIWFRNDWRDTIIDTLGNRSKSDVVRGEVQTTWTLDEANIMTAGIEGNYDRVGSNIWGSHTGSGMALYAQHEIKFIEELRLTLGARYDFQDLDSLSSNSQLNPKLGIVYTPQPGSAVRASFGRGFRSPTVAEAFISTTAGGFLIVPNPALLPERSYSYEVGGSQALGEIASLDLAFFLTDFSDLVETGFDTLGRGVFSNVTRARITGLETSLKCGLFDRALLLDASYMYISPRDRTRDDVLKYRPRNLFYASVLARFGMFTLGSDFRHLSRIERIDDEFVAPLLGRPPIIPDGDQRVSIYVTDLRFGADFSTLDVPLTASLNVNNIFQYNYVELIGNMAPPRSVVLVLETRL